MDIEKPQKKYIGQEGLTVELKIKNGTNRNKSATAQKCVIQITLYTVPKIEGHHMPGNTNESRMKNTSLPEEYKLQPV